MSFVGDIVLANVHFKLSGGSKEKHFLLVFFILVLLDVIFPGWRVDRSRLRDIMNQERGDFVASYEPLVHDVSVSIKHWRYIIKHLGKVCMRHIVRPTPVIRGAVRCVCWRSSVPVVCTICMFIGSLGSLLLCVLHLASRWPWHHTCMHPGARDAIGFGGFDVGLRASM